MFRITNYPVATFAISFLVLTIMARLGARFANRLEGIREEFSLVLTATLTLLGLIVGFTFSMAVSRYDQRKLYEEEEANSIGTEYLRAELLAPSATAEIRTLLREYLQDRSLFYQPRDGTAAQ